MMHELIPFRDDTHGVIAFILPPFVHFGENKAAQYR
jgi:hypothetical protein